MWRQTYVAAIYIHFITAQHPALHRIFQTNHLTPTTYPHPIRGARGFAKSSEIKRCKVHPLHFSSQGHAAVED